MQMRYSNQLNDDFGDYVLSKKEWDQALAEFLKTNKTGSVMKNLDRLQEWLKQNPSPKNPLAGPTWNDLSSKQKYINILSGLISIALWGFVLWAIFSK